MKKFLSILLVIFLVLTSFSVLSSAEESEEVTSVDLSQSLAVEWFSIDSTAEYVIRSIDYDGESSRTRTFCVKNNVISSEFNVVNTLKAKFVYKIGSDTVSVYFPDFPLFYFDLYFEFSDLLDEILDINDCILFETFDESEYNVERLVFEDGSERLYYFKDNKPVKFENYNEYGFVTSKSEIISTEVSDRDIRVPLLAVNVTPLLNLMLILGY